MTEESNVLKKGTKQEFGMLLFEMLNIVMHSS